MTANYVNIAVKQVELLKFVQLMLAPNANSKHKHPSALSNKDRINASWLKK